MLLFILIFSLLLSPVYQVTAQSSQSSSTSDVLEPAVLPQWVKDLRRWDIIAFGLFPFSMFFTTFFTDLVRWYNAGDAPFSDNRYAPWPIKSAGAVEMTTQEFQRTILIAAGVSVTVALVDMLIVQLRRRNERRRIESMPSGSIVIQRVPINAQEQELEQELEDNESGNIDAEITE